MIYTGKSHINKFQQWTPIDNIPWHWHIGQKHDVRIACLLNQRICFCSSFIYCKGMTCGDKWGHMTLQGLPWYTKRFHDCNLHIHTSSTMISNIEYKIHILKLYTNTTTGVKHQAKILEIRQQLFLFYTKPSLIRVLATPLSARRFLSGIIWAA